MIVTARQLIENPRDIRPHVVLLGAGASRAAFPNGDETGNRIPIMNDLVDVIGLQPLIDQTGIQVAQESNFEAIYSQLAIEPEYTIAIKEIERRIYDYFSSLSLPNAATTYDRLLMSLRPTDAVITFNWDPFLFDAYQRNRGIVPLPEIFFLHGNVRIGACSRHDKWGARNERCPECGQSYMDVPLLYPIKQKKYSEDSYIRRNWEAAKALFREAFTITIFGYGAPDSDVDAIELLRSAWYNYSNRTIEHIEIIDIASPELLHMRWSPFTPTSHLHVRATFEESRIYRWPRRSCESLYYPMRQGVPCADFPLPKTDNISELRANVADIARHENGHTL